MWGDVNFLKNLFELLFRFDLVFCFCCFLYIITVSSINKYLFCASDFGRVKEDIG